MIEIAYYLVIAGGVLTALALVGYLVLFTGHRTAAERPATKRRSTADDGDVMDEFVQPSTAARAPAKHKANSVATMSTNLTRLALLALTVALIVRWVAVGHAPMSNQYEFATAFIWSMLLAYVAFEAKYRVRSLSIFVLPLVIAGELYAIFVLDHNPQSLLPALQNNYLLPMHVITATLGYGAAAVSSAAAILYLLKPHVRWQGIPSQEVLDDLGYRGVVVAFPLLTLMNILGALWADIAWGRYWGFDPKETAALVTWLIYGAYIHARVTRGWQGDRSAWLLIVGFAAILFTFLGNHFFGGLHTYA